MKGLVDMAGLIPARCALWQYSKKGHFGLTMRAFVTILSEC